MCDRVLPTAPAFIDCAAGTVYIYIFMMHVLLL